MRSRRWWLDEAAPFLKPSSPDYEQGPCKVRERVSLWNWAGLHRITHKPAVPAPNGPIQNRGPALPWLRTPLVAVLVLALCAPFLLVEVPPLVDMPGHMGKGGIEAAGPDSPLNLYFNWRWMFTLNMAGEVLLKVLGMAMGMLAAGWWSTVLATGLFAFGCLAVIRVLNPRGGHGAGWALVFVFSFPLLTGFLNYILATGIALTAFAGAVWWENRPRLRAAMLLAAQPIALLCHAIGGILLPMLVFMHEVGRLIEERVRSPREIAQRLIVACWPLGMSLVTIVIWKLMSADQGARGGLKWRWMQKAWSFVLSLRDQSLVLDAGTMLACIAIVLLGAFFGARWTWRRALLPLCVFVLFAIIPSDIQGSALIDIRLLPVAFMLALGLQDWSGARPNVARAIAVTGGLVLAVRLVVIGVGFLDYREDYARQLRALEHVERGSRVLVFVQHSCMEESWRNTRRDHISSLSSIYREAWVNDNWAVPGLHMLTPKFKPARYFAADPSEFVWSRKCGGGRLRSVDGALKRAPVDKVDYLWLIDTGMPRRVDTRLSLIWQEGNSLLFAVNHLGFPRYPRVDKAHGESSSWVREPKR